MRKFILTIFACFYLFTSVGANLSLHYCMDRLVGWGFAAPDQHSDDGRCGHCGMEKKDSRGCCSHQHKPIKLAGDQKAADNLLLASALLHPAPMPASFADHYVCNLLLSAAQAYPVSHAPPSYTGVALHVRNRVFLI